ncbi:MAG: TetR/AcrR family transcriptional regulator [Microbacterium sp.]
MAGRASVEAARATRARVLQSASELASLEGFESITIGRLAEALAMSKSGVIGQFRTREELQLETIETVLERFRDAVWVPSRAEPRGLRRLLAVCEAWVDYACDPGYPGGCLITQATYDYDARTGAIHDRLREGREEWRRTLRFDLRHAVEEGELPASTDVEATVFGLESLAAFITPARLLHSDGQAAEHALTGMRRLLGM